jgi:glycosyltransferase involved in cell wall biosynthesis
LKIYIIIKHDKIGGAEKRFTGLWANLVRQQGVNKYFLILSQELLEELITIDDLKDTLLAFKENIIIHKFSGGYLQNTKQAYKLINSLKSKESYFHFIEFFPAYYPLGAKLLFSITASNLGIYSAKGRVSQYLGTLFSKKVDILDPQIFKSFSSIFGFKKKNISLTPCTYCNTEKFVIEQKQNWIVFLGIFTHIKQPLKYLKSIPTIFKKIEHLNLKDLKFFLLGNDGMETEILEELKLEKYKKIPIEIKFCSNPEEYLNKSKVFVSLQLFNNYPSKSLVEALTSGNIPIVTDNGQTRLLANEDFSYYVKEDFEEEEIASVVEKVFLKSEIEFNEKSTMARNFILNNHTLTKMSDFYKDKFYNFHS